MISTSHCIFPGLENYLSSVAVFQKEKKLPHTLAVGESPARLWGSHVELSLAVSLTAPSGQRQPRSWCFCWNPESVPPFHPATHFFSHPQVPTSYYIPPSHQLGGVTRSCCCHRIRKPREAWLELLERRGHCVLKGAKEKHFLDLHFSSTVLAKFSMNARGRFICHL